MTKIDQIIADWREPIQSLETLLRIVASRLSVCLEFIRTDADLERIARDRSAYVSQLRETLNSEFVRADTEGLLIEHVDPQPGDRRYLVVVDARGVRAPRAYFTAWHEIAHVITTPPQLELKLFRRTPSAAEVRKDAVEAAVDHVAGALAFYEPIFGRALEGEVQSERRLSFRTIERARDLVAPSASLYAAAVAAVRLRPGALCFVRAEPRLKPTEARRLRSVQRELGLGLQRTPVVPRLRLVDVIVNDAARRSGLRLHEHLRVPPGSVISRVYVDQLDVEQEAEEDQAWWETSADGPLPTAALYVSAVARGRSVYALITVRNRD